MFLGKEVDELLCADFGVGFLEHVVESFQLVLAEDEMNGTAGGGEDDTADIRIMDRLMIFLFIGYDAHERLKVIRIKGKHGRPKANLEVLTFFAFHDISVLSGITVLKLTHAFLIFKQFKECPGGVRVLFLFAKLVFRKE